MAIDSSTTVFKADISNFRSAMQEAARAVKLANSEFKAATAGMDSWSNSTDGLSAKCKQLSTVLQAQERQLDVLKNRYAEVAKEEGEDSKGAQELAIKINNQTAAIKNTEAELDKYSKELDEAEKENKELGTSVDQSSDAVKRANDGFTVMKGVLADLAAQGIRVAVTAIKDLATEAFNVGASFESAMSKVEAVSGASAEEMVRLTDKAKEMGEKTKFSATESAEAFNYMAMAGWKTEEMLDGIEGIMNLAAASGSDLATTSDIVTDALTAMGYSASDAGKFADVMAAASSNANTNVEMMGETFKYAAPLAGALGYSIEDTAVAIGLMANAGVKGQKAGTALRSMFSRLSAPPKECADAMDKLGISLTDTEGKMRPFSDVMHDLRDAFSNLSETEQTANAKHIAGQEAMSGLLAIVNATEQDFNKLTQAVEGSAGAAEKMAKTMNNNVNGQLTLLKSNIEGKMIKVFESATPAIKKAIGGITDAVNGMNWDAIAEGVGEFAKTLGGAFEFLLKNGGAIIDVLKTIGAVMATVFVVNTLGSFIGTVNALTAAYGSLGAIIKAVTQSQLAMNAAQLASPLGIVLVGVTSLVAGTMALRNAQSEAAKEAYGLSDAERELRDSIESTYDTQKSLIETREKNVEAITGEYNYLKDLKDEYNSLIGVNGEVKEGYEARANFIITELANALGMEKSQILELIGVNGQLSGAIDEVIQKKQVEATLGAYEDSYKQAKASEAETLKNLIEIQNASVEADRVATEKREEYARIEKQAQEQIERSGILNADLADKLHITASESKNASEKAEELKKALEDQNAVFDNNATTIQNYEGLKTASLENDANATAKWMDNLTHSYKDASSMTEEELKKQIQAQQEYVDQMVEAQKSGNQRISDEAIAGARQRLSELQSEMAKGTQAATEEAQKTGDAYAKTIGEAVGAVQKSGQTIKEALEQNIESKKASSIGADTVNNYSQGLTGAASNARAAGETVEMNAEQGLSSGDATSVGYNLSAGFAQGILNGQNLAINAAIQVIQASINAANNTAGIQSPSKVTKKIGQFFTEGFAIGITSLMGMSEEASADMAQGAINSLTTGLDEHSPSKLTYDSGKNFTQGFINGIASLQSSLVNTVKNLAAVAVNALKNTKYDFSGAAENATNAISGVISKNLKYINDRISYENSLNLADFDSTIKGLEAQRDAALKKASDKSDKAIAKLEKERDKAIKKKDSKTQSKEIKKIKEDYEKKIKKQKEAYQKETKNIENQYKGLIETQKKYKEAYQNSAKVMTSDLSSALSEYEQAANKLINDTINGITNKYQARYDALLAKQQNLIDKLKGASELFNVSSAGIMTINDINKQTQDILDYTNKLAAIKNKVSAELFDEIASFEMKEGGAFIDRLLQMSASDLEAYDRAYTNKLQVISDKTQGIYQSDFEQVASDYQREIDTAFAGIPAQLEALGQDAMQGFINGFLMDTDYMDDQIKTFVTGMVDQFKSLLQIASPSKIMYALGEYTGIGFADGLASTQSYLRESAGELVNAVRSPSYNMNGAIGYGSTNITNNYNLVQNNTSPKSLSALETYQARRQQIALIRAFAP